MERTKRISGQTLMVAILSLLLVASLVLTATGAWFTDSIDDITGVTETFGTIVLGDEDATLSINMTEGDVIMPGDDIDVEFDLINFGTADMFVRFQLVFSGDGADAITDATGPIVGFTREDFDTNVEDEIHDYWYVKTTELVNEPGAGTDNQVIIDEVFEIATSVSEVEGDTVTIALTIEAVQSANNSLVAGTWDSTVNWG